MNADIIYKYFPDLTDEQRRRFDALEELYTDWNEKINVISRKDIGNLYANHVLHSLAIAAFLGDLQPGTTIMDVGTGGGFPGIPLAIMYPHCQLHLVDRIGKKVRVATSVAAAIGLDNVTTAHGDVRECKQCYDYVVSRAVMPLNDLVKMVRRNVIKGGGSTGNRYADGLVCLKGGDLTDERQGIREPVMEIPVSDYFGEAHFEDKYIIYVPLC